MTEVGIDHLLLQRLQASIPLFFIFLIFFLSKIGSLFNQIIQIHTHSHTQIRREKMPVINKCVSSVDAGDH